MSFFEPRGERYLATENTRGPWDARLMHGGPPSALLVRAFERLAGDDMQLARVTLELVRPLVIGELALATEVVRPGRKVRLFSGSLSGADGKELVRASALAIRRVELDLEGAKIAPVAAPTPPDGLGVSTFPFFREAVGYHTAMEMRFAAGRFGEGALTAWMRMRVPLVPGEAPSGWQRAVCAADSSNGVSVALDLRRHTFLNPDLNVILHRVPEGEWICLDAVTRPEATGIGMAESALHDTRGPVGRAVQTLIIEPRDGL